MSAFTRPESYSEFRYEAARIALAACRTALHPGKAVDADHVHDRYADPGDGRRHDDQDRIEPGPLPTSLVAVRYVSLSGRHRHRFFVRPSAAAAWAERLRLSGKSPVIASAEGVVWVVQEVSP